jgi:NTP pyrophosphatase (non-canonical NTP hydrolase)
VWFLILSNTNKHKINLAMGYLTDGLTFNGLREANKMRLPQFKDANGVVCHQKEDGSDWSLNDWMTAVAGECGELANVLKKVRRGDFTKESAMQQIADEAADIIVYLDLLTSVAGIDLGRAVMEKFNRVSERVGSNVVLDAEGGHYRNK